MFFPPMIKWHDAREEENEEEDKDDREQRKGRTKHANKKVCAKEWSSAWAPVPATEVSGRRRRRDVYKDSVFRAQGLWELLEAIVQMNYLLVQLPSLFEKCNLIGAQSQVDSSRGRTRAGKSRRQSERVLRCVFKLVCKFLRDFRRSKLLFPKVVVSKKIVQLIAKFNGLQDSREQRLLKNLGVADQGTQRRRLEHQKRRRNGAERDEREEEEEESCCGGERVDSIKKRHQEQEEIGARPHSREEVKVKETGAAKAGHLQENTIEHIQRLRAMRQQTQQDRASV